VPDDRHHDVMIVGSGAGGGTLGHRPAPSGTEVRLLERGDHDRSSTAVFAHGTYRAPESWYDANGDEFPPEVGHRAQSPTTFHGAALFRLRPEDVGELRHHGGVSPARPISPSSPSSLPPSEPPTRVPRRPAAPVLSATDERTAS
jgi:choline dehydrogenase-like flavoprotein